MPGNGQLPHGAGGNNCVLTLSGAEAVPGAGR